MKRLLVSFTMFSTLFLFSCSKAPNNPVDSSDPGSADVSISIGKVGALGKIRNIELSKLYLTLSAPGETTKRDTFSLSGNTGGTYAKTYSNLASLLKTWTLTAESWDVAGNTIHYGVTSFIVPARSTIPVTLTLGAKYSMLKANFFPILDSVTRCELLVNGTKQDDSAFAKQALLGDTVKLSFNYLDTGAAQRIKLNVYGTMWGFDTLLYSGDTLVMPRTGINASYNVMLKWVGPALPPPGQASMSVTLGAVGTVTVNGEMFSALGLPENAFIASIWAKQENNVFLAVVQNPSTDSSKISVYYYNGISWNTQLQLSGGNRYVPGSKNIFGTSENDVFLNVRNSNASISEIYHFNGTIWQQQTMPASLGSDGLSNFVGEANNIYAGAGPNVFKYNGTSWQQVANLSPGGVASLVYISANEIYALDCWGHTLWNGTSWIRYQSFDFCDVSCGWGMRDANNNLFMFAVGTNNFQNGIKAWRFVESSPGSKSGTWGSKYDCTYLCDPSGSGSEYAGFGNDIWGSGPNDIYVVGHFGHPYNPTYALRVFHSDGSYPFTRMTVFDSMPLEINANNYGYISITGTGPADVWIAVGNKLAHYFNAPNLKWTLF